MNFVAQLEEYYRDLGAESRKKHPGVKEASERATLKLREKKNEYVSAVRKATSTGAEHPTTSLFQLQDLLHPFLLAANYPNASTKLLDISFKAMRLLMESNAICTGDGIHMVRVWTIQAHVIMSQYHKSNKQSMKKDGENGTSSSTPNGSSASSKASSIASSTASWLIGGLIGGGGGGGASSTSASIASTSDTPSKPIKNAVSSSSGQSGQYAPSNKDMEKIALEILSCLLKLVELLKDESPSNDLWTQSVSLCCILLDYKKTVQQAAHSTLPQVLSTLYQSSQGKKYNQQTWEDLLMLASYGPSKKPPTLQGAFAQCRLDTSSSKAPPPPTPGFALVLMATILKERPDFFAASDKFLAKTMGVSVSLLQQTTNKSFDLTKTLRVFQWTLVLLQTQPTATLECRELLMHVIKPINSATDACRNQNDFDDGYVYTGEQETAEKLSSPPPSNRSARRLSSAADTSNGQQNTNVYASKLPAATMWKAGLAVETVYHVLSNCSRAMRMAPNDPTVAALARLLDRQTIVLLTETLSEFSTIGAGCQSHIMQLAEVCRKNNKQASANGDGSSSSLSHSKSDLLIRSLSRDDDHKSSTEIEPMLFHRAEQLINSGSGPSIFDESSNTAISDKKKPSSGSSPISQTVHVMGEALWIAFHGVVELVASVLPSCSPEVTELLAEAAFAPSLETLQHFMKRVPGSRELCRTSLNGYAHMSHLCMPSTTPGRSFKRKALLSSLCKLSLPGWGKHDRTRQLHNHHVRALICLLRIIHSHYEHIRSEWDMVLLTFEELSVLSIASPQLSDQMYHAALAVSAVYGRFAPFSTCFSNESLLDFLEALGTVSSSAHNKRDFTTGDNAVLDRVLVPSEPSKPGEKVEEGKESIGGKLVNLGVRAIYGGQSSSETIEANMHDMPVAKRTISSFYEAYRNDYVGRLEKTTTSSMRPDLVAILPFGLALLADVAMSNSFRYNICVGPAGRHICSFASVAPAIRDPVMDTVSMLILTHLTKETNSMSFNSPARLVYQDPKQHQLLAVEPSTKQVEVTECDVSFADLFGPLCECIQTAKSAVVTEAAITTLTSILESVGHTLTGEVWVLIINAIASLSGESNERKSSEWSNCCLLGFRCLKLTVDDFLDNLPPPSATCAARSSLLDCCSSYGRSRHDVNTSLTAIGLLWTIADQDVATDAIDRAFAKLVALAGDSRPEVRNCSVNTLFSCIVGRGNSFSAAQWESCISEKIFGVYDLVLSKANASGDGKVDLDGNAVASSKSRYKVNIHHSRDSAGKQWVATQVLTLQGLNRVLRSFFGRLLEHLDEKEPVPSASLTDVKPMQEEEESEEEESEEEKEGDSYSYEDEDETESDEDETEEEQIEQGDLEESHKENDPWLVKAWTRILDFGLQAAAQEGGRDTVDLRYAGVELLVLCGQLACKAGIQAAITPARVGTKMQVIDGALREADSNNERDSTTPGFQRSHSKVVDDCREALFSEAMKKMCAYKDFIETAEGSREGTASGMESTQAQVLQRYVTCLSSLYDCCKDEELSQSGDSGDKMAIKRYFEQPSDPTLPCHLESNFVEMLASVARAASGGPRFLSQAQRAAIDLLRSMIKHGSSEAVFKTVSIAGPWLFCRKDEGQDTAPPATSDSGANVLSCEFAAVLADEIAGAGISDLCKALALWVALSHFPEDIFNRDRNSEGRRKAYYKHFLPVLQRGLDGALSVRNKSPAAKNSESLLVADIWATLCEKLSRILAPVPDAFNLQKISRIPEVLEMVRYSVDFVPADVCEDLCSVLSQGAAEALSVEKANRHKLEDGEMNKRRIKYREDALLVFKTCYAGMCRKKPDDPSLLSITDKAFADALATIDQSDGAKAHEEVSVDTFLMVCQAFEESPGVEGLIVSSFPLLCKLVQTKHEAVRNAAAGALGSADLRQVLSDARVRYEDAEKRATKAEEEVAELNTAVAELQKKNESLQQQIEMAPLHLT